MNMLIVVTGGNGFVGRALVTFLVSRGHEVRILDRTISKKPREHVTSHEVNLTRPINPELLAGAHALVHLAGTPIIGRWTTKYKDQLRKSRIKSARRIIDALRALPAVSRPNVVVSASAIGFYGNRGDVEVDERAQPGHDFLARLCNDWESVWEALEELSIRRVSIRTGIVIAPNGGMVAKLKKGLKFKINSVLGTGEQWVSWVGLEDLVRVYTIAIEKKSLRGPINAVTGSMKHRDFMSEIGRVYDAKVTLPVPAFAIKLALGQASDVVLFSQRVKPSVLSAVKYQYQADTITQALK